SGELPLDACDEGRQRRGAGRPGAPDDRALRGPAGRVRGAKVAAQAFAETREELGSAEAEDAPPGAAHAEQGGVERDVCVGGAWTTAQECQLAEPIPGTTQVQHLDTRGAAQLERHLAREDDVECVA